MSLVYSRSDSGLVIAEHGQDEAAVARALKQHDRELRLVQQVDPATGRLRWCVYSYQGPDRPALFVYAWQTQTGEPLPLSHRLVDEVKAQDRNSRAPRPTEDDLDRQQAVRKERDWERDAEALGNDWAPQHGRPVLHRSQSLRMARDKRRARGEKV